LFWKKDSRKEEGLAAKLRRGAADLLDNPKVRREARRGARRLAEDPRVQRKVREWTDRATQRLRRR
jgi:hypothetical protein